MNRVTTITEPAGLPVEASLFDQSFLLSRQMGTGEGLLLDRFIQKVIANVNNIMLSGRVRTTGAILFNNNKYLLPGPN